MNRMSAKKKTRNPSTLDWQKYLTREYSFLYISYAIDCYKIMERVVGTTITYDISQGDSKLVSLYGLPKDIQRSYQMIEKIAKADLEEIVRKMNTFDELIEENYTLFRQIKETEDKESLRRLLKKLDKVFLETLCYYLFFVYLGYAGDFPHITKFLKKHSKRFHKIRLYTIDMDMEKQFPKLFAKYDKKLQSLAPHMSRKELIAYINDKPVDLQKARNRKKRYLVITKVSRTIEYEPDMIDKVLRRELAHLQAASEQNEVNGRIAYKGVVKGNARLVFITKDYKKIQDGDILVTPMTKPSVVPRLSKVKGIITNDGGALSHASIISREMKIPCIVGTDNATDVFKDGDKVFLDAEAGVAKRL